MDSSTLLLVQNPFVKLPELFENTESEKSLQRVKVMEQQYSLFNMKVKSFYSTYETKVNIKLIKFIHQRIFLVMEFTKIFLFNMTNEPKVVPIQRLKGDVAYLLVEKDVLIGYRSVEKHLH